MAGIPGPEIHFYPNRKNNISLFSSFLTVAPSILKTRMKKIILAAILFLSAGAAFSQTFMHGVGIVTFIQGAPGYSTSVTGGFTYSPRINFAETESSSFSVGLPFSVGLSASATTYSEGTSSASLMADIPLVLNFNYGAGSGKENADRIGFFIGGGFGYHYRISEYDDGYEDVSDKISGFGPLGNAGVRIGVGRSGKNIEIKFSYMKSLDLSKSNIIGIGGLFNF
jgi:hypothetical protein